VDRSLELTLVARLRAGDADAFDAVHAAFNRRLFTFLLRLVRRHDAAEDLLDEVWMRLLRHAERLQPETRLGPWLFTVARNLHVSYVRSRLLEDTTAAGLMGLWLPRASHVAVRGNGDHEFERRLGTRHRDAAAGAREVLLLVVSRTPDRPTRPLSAASHRRPRQRLHHQAREALARWPSTGTWRRVPRSGRRSNREHLACWSVWRRFARRRRPSRCAPASCQASPLARRAPGAARHAAPAASSCHRAPLLWLAAGVKRAVYLVKALTVAVEVLAARIRG
jgi:RNA polymerase sigma-70 factor (ECF subfamily)